MLAAPVDAVGVDGVFAEDFASVLVDDGGGVGVDEDEASGLLCRSYVGCGSRL